MTLRLALPTWPGVSVLDWGAFSLSKVLWKLPVGSLVCHCLCRAGGCAICEDLTSYTTHAGLADEHACSHTHTHTDTDLNFSQSPDTFRISIGGTYSVGLLTTTTCRNYNIHKTCVACGSVCMRLLLFEQTFCRISTPSVCVCVIHFAAYCLLNTLPLIQTVSSDSLSFSVFLRMCAGTHTLNDLQSAEYDQSPPPHKRRKVPRHAQIINIAL